jgi:predicted nuclease of predicted toxin-antitoxin system
VLGPTCRLLLVRHRWWGELCQPDKHAMRVVASLRESGHDVVHLRDRGLQRLPNGEIFRLAAAERRIVLTFDLDFGEIAAQSGGAWASVVLFRLSDARSLHVIARLHVALAATGDALEKGAVVVVEESRCRVRALPIRWPAGEEEPPATA